MTDYLTDYEKQQLRVEHAEEVDRRAVLDDLTGASNYVYEAIQKFASATVAISHAATTCHQNGWDDADDWGRLQHLTDSLKQVAIHLLEDIDVEVERRNA